MSENLVTIKTILDFSETEREFKKLLNRLNSESAIKVKIDSPDVSGLNAVINKMTQINSSYQKFTSFPNAGQKLSFSAFKYACPH